MMTIAEKALRAAKAKYFREILFKYEFEDCSVEEIKTLFNRIFDMNAQEFYFCMESLLVAPEDICFCRSKNVENNEDNEYKPGDWYQDDYVGGIIREDGSLDVCEEYGPPADFGLYDVDVANGLGYYDDDGYFVRYKNYD